MSNHKRSAERDLVTDAVFAESNEEFILPDYMPEIGRVLRVSATLLPDEPYLESDGTEFSGKIEYRLLYGDGEGNITEAPLEGRYRYRIPHTAKAAVVYTEERTESVGARPSAPRKLGIRTRIYARPHFLTDEEMGAPLSALIGDEASYEAIESEREFLTRTAVFSGNLRAEDCFTVEDASPDALFLLSVQSASVIEGKTAHDGYLSVEGKLIFTLLLKKEGDTPFVKLCTIPFSEDIAAADAQTGHTALARAFIAAPSVSFEADGEDTALRLCADYSLFGVLMHNRRASVLEDLYVHGMHHDIQRKSFSAQSLGGCASGVFTARGEQPLPSELDATGCLYPSFSVKEAKAVREKDKILVSGELSSLLLCFGGKETGRCEATLPFLYEVTLPFEGTGEESLTLSVTPTVGEAQTNGGNISLSCELAVDVTSTCAVSLSLPYAAVATGKVSKAPVPTAVLYYPSDGDTLWSVGKRYGVPLSLLKEQNDIPAEEDSIMPLDGYAYLLVSEL